MKGFCENCPAPALLEGMRYHGDDFTGYGPLWNDASVRSCVLNLLNAIAETSAPCKAKEPDINPDLEDGVVTAVFVSCTHPQVTAMIAVAEALEMPGSEFDPFTIVREPTAEEKATL